MLRYLTILTALIMSLAIVACEPDSASEQAADHIEDAGDEMKSAAEDAGDSMKAAAEDVGNEVEDACEELKEGAGAKDTDC